MTKQLFKRLVRFVSSDGKTYYGDAILAPGTSDARFAREARVISGNVLAEYRIEDKILPIRQLLSPLDPVQVPTARFLGLNYRKHAAEVNMKLPKYPVLFYKPRTSLGNPTDDIPVPPMAQGPNQSKNDYECELVVVIGRTCYQVSTEEALDYVLGYSVGNDVSNRSWQIELGNGQWSLGKMFDGWAPFGPAIVSPEVTGSPGSLQITTKLNGDLVQNESTSDMIFSVQETISFLSQGSTLLPGDLIFMGTPSGVGTGRKPAPYWLKNGDDIEIGLSNVGSIKNKVVFTAPRAPAKL